jgi:hypothetical protein
MSASTMFDLVSGGQSLPPDSYPPAPTITGVTWRPPNETAWFDTKSSLRLMMKADSVNHGWSNMVSDMPDKDGPWPNLIAYNADVNSGRPLDYTLTLRSKLVLIPDSYASVTYPNTTTRKCSASYGISSTDEMSIGTEIGVEAGGVSAKIEATFTQSVTTSQVTTEEKEWNIASPKEGVTRIWMLWQVVDELVALDNATGEVIEHGTRRGWASFAGQETDDAFLNYLSVSQVFPSQSLIISVADFPPS